MDKMNSLAQFLRANSISLVNGGIALTTLGGQQLFSLLAYNCPCAVTANYAYGVVAIGVPALLLLALGWALNPTAWLLLGDCCRRGRGSAPTPLCALLGALLGVATRAAVAPLTWIAVSLLSGDFYVCAASEFRSPGEFVRGGGGVAVTPSRDAPRHDLAAVPCKGEPLGLNLAPGFSRDAMLRQLKYESQSDASGSVVERSLGGLRVQVAECSSSCRHRGVPRGEHRPRTHDAYLGRVLSPPSPTVVASFWRGCALLIHNLCHYIQ
ncbi:calcium homeostasis modulator protein 2 isoform X2 [Lampetra fluviatilis]